MSFFFISGGEDKYKKGHKMDFYLHDKIIE